MLADYLRKRNGRGIFSCLPDPIPFTLFTLLIAAAMMP
jgi:hypothetical protein